MIVHQNKKKLIEQFIPTEVIKTSDGKIEVTAPFLKCDIKVANGYEYKKSTVEPEVEKYKIYIKERDTRACGELDHPYYDDDNMDKYFLPSMQNAALLVTDLWWDGSILYGKYEPLLNHSKGKDLKAFHDQKIKTGISMRAYGTVENGVVQDDFMLITWDAVSSPSSPGSFTLMESKNYLVEQNLKIYKIELENRINNLIISSLNGGGAR